MFFVSCPKEDDEEEKRLRRKEEERRRAQEAQRKKQVRTFHIYIFKRNKELFMRFQRKVNLSLAQKQNKFIYLHNFQELFFL